MLNVHKPDLHIPHVRIVVAVSAFVLSLYTGFSIWVVGWSHDPALIGDTIGTWKSFAVAGVAFWLGSSSGGKAKDLPVMPPSTPAPLAEIDDEEGAAWK